MQVFITGVSRGLGKALAEKYLERGYKVTGIGRSNDIDHPRFSFISCDLRVPEEVQSIDFGIIQDEVIFVNNAGVIGSIKRLSDQKIPDVAEVMQVNTIAPMLFSRAITKAVPADKLLTILNISSGAGRRPIPSWSAYCASKAALDMFSQTFQLEEREKERKINVFSIAPGVIDTDMQKTIRRSDADDFSSRTRFEELSNNNQLSKPADVADRLMEFISNSNESTEVVCSL